MCAGASVKALAAAFAAIAVGAVVCSAAPARAADFVVSPVQASLAPRSPSALLNLTNTGTKELRFELSAYSWAQDGRGKILLSPTDDIVFFPQLLSLAPGEQRKIRVGTLSPAVDSEKTYRLFIEQLPSGKKHSQAVKGVELLTRVGIPVFVRPALAKTAGAITGLTIAGGKLSFGVTNSGNVHLVVESVRVAGLGDEDHTAFVKQAKGWYVLAGQTTLYELDVDPAECRRSGAVEVSARTADVILRERLSISSASCATARGASAAGAPPGLGG